MTVFEKFQALELDKSQLGLEPGEEHSDYFCAPVGTRVIGWAGVDGIHYCFVEGFGDTVFAVSPANLPGDYVHPLAGNFEDFVRLVLACNGTDAVEQAHGWTREQFDGYLAQYPPEGERQAALDALGAGLALEPMDDPYGYIKGVQSAFDYGALSFGEDYWDFVGRPAPPPKPPEWRVTYDGGWWSREGREQPGKEIAVDKTFAWGGNVWHVPAVYLCGKGLVVDLCMEIEPDQMRQFWTRWRPWMAEGRVLTPEEGDRQRLENPMSVNCGVTAWFNGRELRCASGSGFGWTPPDCRPDWEEQGEVKQDYEGLWVLEHYGLDREKCWLFWRESFPWVTKTKPKLREVTLTLSQPPQARPGARFTVSGAGEDIPFIHPITGREHVLHVEEYEPQELDAGQLAHMDDGVWEYPTQFTSMTYAVWPDLPQGAVSVQDCGEGDRPRRKAPPDPMGPTASNAVALGVIGGASGPVVVVLANRESARRRGSCSALRFHAGEPVEWRLVFYEKTAEDLNVNILP